MAGSTVCMCWQRLPTPLFSVAAFVMVLPQVVQTILAAGFAVLLLVGIILPFGGGLLYSGFGFAVKLPCANKV